MKNIIRIISLIFVVTAIGGCGKSQQYQKSTDFPKGMKTELTEQIKVNAEFQYPENCKNGKCAETQISGQTLWDKQEEIAQLLVQDGNITNEYIDDYGTVQYKIYEIAENNATLVISDDNLNYATDQASYAPFYDKYQLFVIMRGGTSEWVLGHIMYIFSVSILYMLCLTGISILIIFPNVCLSGEWGRIWTTLALTDAGEQFGLSFGVSGYLIFEYRPLEAMFLVGGLGFFICSFYGLCLWCLNLCVGKIISFVTVSASIILVTRIKYLPEWIMYLTPSAWMDLNNLSKYARYEIDVVRAFIILVLGCLCLSGIAYYVTVHSDISG